MPDYFDLGSYTRRITTASSEAAAWFDRGLLWCYGFNQEEALRCFEKVVEIDPDCAMGYWGIAYAAGPFYNKPWEWYGAGERVHAIRFCREHALEAEHRRHLVSPLEQSLIDALCRKHPAESAADEAELAGWNLDYADAMRGAYAAFDDDLDVICLTAEAVMNLTPWKLWDLQRGVPAENANTREAIDMLERGLQITAGRGLAPHPGILHFHIHAWEMSPTPERALPSADRLRDLCPDAGHLRHMASHIDSLCGHWQNAADANDRGIEADRKYMDLRGRDEFYMISVLHNYHFKIWAAMFLGRYRAALEAADGIRRLLRDKCGAGDQWYLALTLEAYHAERAHVLVRFGKWREICDEEMPADPDSFPITTIFLVYAKAIAHAALGDFDGARACQRQFRRLYRQIPEYHLMHNNPSRNILAVGEAMMDGEIEYHAGNHEPGFSHLREAVRLCDNLEYSEPWPWLHPPRHALGALLLEQGQVEEAVEYYADDLGIGNRLPRCVQHPDNIWALHGYHECLLRLGRQDEARVVEPRLRELLDQSDIEINASCCCRGMNAST